MNRGVAHDRPAKEQKRGPGWASLREKGWTVLPVLHIDEASLVFGGRKEDADPRLGLKYFGPFHTDERNQRHRCVSES